jgi:uncharacterized protein
MKTSEEERPAPAQQGATAPDEPVTVVVRRRIKPGCEEAFESAMREFINFTLGFPGHREIHVVRPQPNHSREYTVVDKFIDGRAREAFKGSPEYKGWMGTLGELTEGPPTIEEMGGLAGWFTLPDEPTAKPPPKYKMAIVTFFGVFPLALLIPRLLKPISTDWHPLLIGALINAGIVASLTWLVMPLLTRIFRRWLFSHQTHP